MATSSLQSLLDSFEARLGAVEKSLGIEASTAGNSSGRNATATAADLPAPSVVAFEEHCTACLDPFIKAADELGGGASTYGGIVKRAWTAQKAFLVMASKCKKPADVKDLMPHTVLFQQCNKDLAAATKRDEWERHAKTVSEGLSCINWVMVAPPTGLPKDIVESAIGGQDYWANKIRVEFKKTEPKQVAFCDTFKALLNGLMEYVKTNHNAGVEWNPKGGDVKAYSTEAAAATPSGNGSGKSIPPPPGPPPPPAAKAQAPAGPPGGAGLSAVFGELSKGLDVTKGLKKVTKEQQTWRKEYKGGDGPTPVAQSATKKPAARGDGPKGPPKVEFHQAGNKWQVEHQSEADGVVTVQVQNPKHSVYIFGCVGATIDVKGKCKLVCADSCKKTQVIVDSVISAVETVNCQRMKLQVRGNAPAIAVDKTDGFLCYLSKESMDTTFTTSKSSEMNVSFPDPSADDDEHMEIPIPEQFVHKLLVEGKKAKITSDVSDLYSG